MTEECNCLPLKQIPSCPFKTSENMHFFQNFWGFSLRKLLASTGVSRSPWVQSAGQLGTAFKCLHADDLSPGGELFSHLHPSFHPGVCPSRIGACCVQPSAAGWVVSRAETPLPGVPAMHTCVGTYWMLRFWGPSTPAQRLEPVSVTHGHLISWHPGVGTDLTQGDMPLFLAGGCTVGGVLFSPAGAAPMMESKIFSLRSPSTAGNLHLVLQDFVNMKENAPSLFSFLQYRCDSELPRRVGRILESCQETCTPQAMQNGICKLVLSIGSKHCRMDLPNKMHVRL